MKIHHSRLVSLGSYLPEKVVTNYDLEKTLDTSHDWIVQRTGIEQRHIVAENQSVADMATIAAKQAMERANLTPEDIDLIIVATCTPDQIFPSTACVVQQQLEVPICPAFDVQAACSGFIYGLSIADSMLRLGQAKHALVIGAEAMSRVMDWQDRATCVLFGDGAGAAILSQSDTPGIISTHLKSAGQYKELLYLNNAKFHPQHDLMMSGNPVFRLAVKYLGEIVEEVLAKNKIDPSEIDWLIPHQANIRIIQSTAKKLKLSMEKVILTVAKHANTSGASIPLALDHAVQAGSIKPGQNLLLEAFGGGLTWGAALVRY